MKEKPRVFSKQVQLRPWEVRGGFLEEEVPLAQVGRMRKGLPVGISLLLAKS